VIVPMRKITLLCTAADQERSLEALRDLGVLHLAHLNPPVGEDLEHARQELDRTERAIETLPADAEGEPTGKSGPELIREILDLLHRRRALEEQRDSLRAEQQRVAPLGSFDPDAVRDLVRKGIHVGLYRASKKTPVAVPEGWVRVPLSEDRNTRYFALIGRGKPETDAQRVELPQESLPALTQRMEEVANEVAACERRLAEWAADAPTLNKLRAEQQARIEFLEARMGMAAEGPVAYLRGYCPHDAVDAVKSAAAREGWGLLVEEVSADEWAPTLVRNPRWVDIIRPVFEFMNISPGYREVDISGVFLVFFSLFFGMIVGDAGYGLIFIGLTLGLWKKLKSLSLQIAPLLLVMSVATVVWGALTGTFFGLERVPPLLRAAQVEWLRNHDNVMLICFIIGAVHLTIAHGWSAVRMMNSPQALAQLGWILSTWSMFFIACNMVLRYPLPGFLLPMLLAAIVLIALFMTPVRRLKTEFFNHVLLPLNLISNFVDVVSYIRLFAVGLATFAVGNAFNNLAVGTGVDSVLMGLVAALVLFAGHTLNIVMALMGVMVHGIRLNTLEFSGHLGMEWTGTKYRPFARNESESEGVAASVCSRRAARMNELLR